MVDVYKKESCRLCDGTQLTCILELAPTPPGNHFLTQEQLAIPQATYPLDLYFCADCHHVQLGHIVHPDILYRHHYSYFSSTSPVFVNHLQQYAHDIVYSYAIPTGSLVVDVGSNDGTALSFFKKAGYRTLGLDPATEVVSIANQKGIETLCEFFSLEVAKRYSSLYGKAALINSHNVCAHIDELQSVFTGVHHWLAEDGLFVIEVGYFLDVFEKAYFDTIYHEHVDFHTFAPLVKFFDRMGFQVIAVQRNTSQGGTLRIMSEKKGGSRPIDASVSQLLQLEKEKGLDQTAVLKQFSTRINAVKKELNKMVRALKAAGYRIAGYGAPTKATTLLTYFGLADCLDYVVDDNPFKQNKFMPGLHLPVYPPQKMYDDKPDYLLVLSWNFADEIMRRQSRYLDQGGQFIVPMPKPRIVRELHKENHGKEASTCTITTSR